MKLESSVLKKIKTLEDDPLKSEISLDKFGLTLKKLGNGKYQLKGANKQLLDPGFRFLVWNKVGDDLEISLPSAEECYSMASEFDDQSKFELNQLLNYGSELLYKLSVGILQVDHD